MVRLTGLYQCTNQLLIWYLSNCTEPYRACLHIVHERCIDVPPISVPYRTNTYHLYRATHHSTVSLSNLYYRIIISQVYCLSFSAFSSSLPVPIVVTYGNYLPHLSFLLPPSFLFSFLEIDKSLRNNQN